MLSVQATLESWSAYAPEMESQQDWRDWSGDVAELEDDGSVKVDFLPAMFRRRLSRLSKLAFRATHACLPENQTIPTVFASRHGELNRTLKLLEDIVDQTLISPTGFSMSVHNTSSGLYSIAEHNHQPSTAISAGKDSLEMAYIEAAAMIQSGRYSQVMVVLVEEPLPEIFQPFTDMTEKSFSMAMLLSNQNSGSQLALSTTNTAIDYQEPHGISVIRLLSQKRSHIKIQGERFSWQWALHDG